MLSSLVQVLRRSGSHVRLLRADERGSVAIICGIALIPMVMIVGLAVDYSRTVTLDRELRSAADAAALAAVRLAAGGANTTDAQAAASSVWAANLSTAQAANASVSQPTISVQTAGNVATASVNYAASQATSFARIAGISAFAVAGGSTAQAGTTTTAHGNFSGNGTVYGDPHVTGADGHHYDINCTSGNWYNLLSDAGVEVNMLCSDVWPSWQAGPNQVFTAYSVLVGTHTVDFSVPIWVNNAAALTPWQPGVITIDGQQQQLTPGQTQTYLNGALSFTYGSTDWNNLWNNTLTLTTPQYTFVMQFDNWNPPTSWNTPVSRYPAGAFTTITASGAGMCGVPGGIWGKTLAAIDDTSFTDFQMSGPSAKAPEFSATTCGILGPHLTQ